MINHYMDMRRYAQASELIGQALANEPEEARYYYLLGFCSYQLDDYSAADEYLQKALALGYNPEPIYEIYGDLYTEQGEWIKAEQAYLDVLRLNPNDARVHAAYAYLLKKIGHPEKADRLMQMALQIDPEEPGVVRYRHLFGLANDDRLEQIRALEQYMQVADNELSKEVQLGLNSLFRNKTKAARVHFRNAYLMDPTNFQLAEVLNDLDQVRHLMLLPVRAIQRMGGPAVFWVVGIGSIYGTRALGWDQATYVVLIVYITWVVYSWLVTPLLKLINKIRG